MLTPQDVQNKEFVKAVFGGYDMSTVDDFLEVLTEDYATLYKDNAILKGKIKVLVEKVEEYRSTEDAMRMALLTAQKMGDDLVAEAKQKSDEMMSQTDSEARQKIEDLQKQIAEEEARLEAAKAKTAEFKKAFENLVAEHSSFLAKLEDMSVSVPAAPKAYRFSAADRKAAEIASTADEIGDNVSKIFAAEEEARAALEQEDEPTLFFRRKKEQQPVDFSVDEEPISPRPKFDFENLKFGSNYSDDEDDD